MLRLLTHSPASRPTHAGVYAAVALLTACGACARATPAPNEAGVIPIVMYHSVGEQIGHRRLRYDRGGLNIRPETFRKQLRLMWAAGWYPVNVRDTTSPRLNVPAGKTPVALTFDDARGSQFRFLPDGRIDPNCAVGILQQFCRQHSDWPLRATFYVLPESRYNPVPFWQRGRAAEKLAWLLRAGCEIANHTVSHGWLNRMTPTRICWEVAEAVRMVRRLAPAATMDTFAAPYGAMPRTRALRQSIAQGTQGGTAYRNLAILKAWGGPAFPCVLRRYDDLGVPRVGASPGEVEAVIRRLAKNKPHPRYVSDGAADVVTVPWWESKQVDPARLQGARLAVLPAPACPARGGAAGHPKER